MILAGLATLALGRVVEKNEPFTDEEHWTLWKHFRTLDGVNDYPTFEEHKKRYNIFKDNMEFAREFNQKGETFELGVTAFADLTQDEFKNWLNKANGVKPGKNLATELYDDTLAADAPDAIDWSDKAHGAVTPIKNQGQCGSCWAFSTTGSIEGQNYLKTKTLSSFSEQELVDCSGSYGNQGCNGGLMDDGFKFVEDEGLCFESAYPYDGVDGTCKKSKCTERVKVKSYVDIPAGNYASLKSAVGTVGPISVAVDANMFWQLYTGGIFSKYCNPSKLDHGVLAVGYGSNYWKVKNSWGPSWGEDGYIRLKEGNTCGIANSASYPVMA